MHRSTLLAAGIVLVAVAAASADDWPQFRGPGHDNTSPENHLVWPSGQMKEIWRIKIGAGYSQICVAKGRAYTLDSQKDQDLALCLDAQSGQILWSTPVGKSFNDNEHGGPRSTPTVDGDRVYVYTTWQKLLCLAAADGKDIWSHNIDEEFAGHEPGMGSAASPLVDGPLVYVCGGGAGQALLAFDKATGNLAWKGQNDKPTHATPLPATIGGIRQIMFLTESGLAGLEAKTGALLWRYPFPYHMDISASPVLGPDAMVYCSAQYQTGAAVAQITSNGDTFKAREVWRRKNQLENHFTTPVFHGGYLYGLYKTDPSTLKCVDMATGKEMWSQKNFGWEGATILVDGNLLVQDSKGSLVLVEASPTQFHELGRWEVLKGPSWTMPTVCDGRLYLRNRKEAVCLDISGK